MQPLTRTIVKICDQPPFPISALSLPPSVF